MNSIKECIIATENDGWDEMGKEARQEVEDIKNFVSAAKEVMKWIENWSPDFTDDSEWEDTEARWKYTLMVLGETE